MWRQMRWIKGLKKPQIHVPYEKKDELLRDLAPDSVQTQPPLFSSKNDQLESKFTVQELENILKKKDTAPGDDSITYTMIYHLPTDGKLYLLKIYNAVFRYCIIPNQWRKIKVVPIPKANSNPNAAPKLRPISLISCVCKIFHCMLCKRIEWYVERNKILPPFTTGFRRNQSCLDCLTHLVSQVQIGFTEKMSTLAVFLDVDNAYNNIDINYLMSTMDKLGMGYRICKYLWNFLSERNLEIKEIEDSQNLIRCTRKGLAQGDPISPLLFNVATHKVISDLNNVFALQYADDFVIYTQSKNVQLNIVNIQVALNSVVRLLEQLGLQVSSTKTKFCQFKKGKSRDQILLHINGNSIPSVDCIKYLGMWLDKSLTWGKHINETVEKTSRNLNLLKVLAGSSWGVHPKHIRRLYISIIRSKIDFGSFLYDVAAKTHLNKLDRVQNCAMRVMGGFIRTTPIHVMEVELCLYPLHLRRQYLATKYCLKAQFSFPKTIKIIETLANSCNSAFWNRTKKPLLPLVFAETKIENVISKSSLNMFMLHVWVSHIKTDFIVTSVEGIQHPKKQSDPSSLKFNTLHMINVVYKGWYHLYTDGSKTNDGIGAAIYDPRRKTNEMFKIVSTQNSIMSVELLAISEALSLVTGLGLRKAVIFTDSLSALQHIARSASGFRSSSVAYEILKKALFLFENEVILRLQWIPSHVGVMGNEEVDRLAKEAIEIGSEVYVMPEITEILSKYRYRIFEKWKSVYNATSVQKGIWYKILQPQPFTIPWFVNCKLKRKFIVLAHRLRSGHIPLNKFNYLMKKSDSPNCPTCGTLEDVHHLLAECVRSESMRVDLRSKYGVNRLDVGAIHLLLSAPMSDAANTLYKLVYDILK